MKQANSGNWKPCKNVGNTEIPSRGLVYVSGIDATDDFDVLLEVEKLNAADAKNMRLYCAVIHHIPIAADGIGRCTFDMPEVVAYDTSDGTPAINEVWGPKDGDYKLRKNYPGFMCLGKVADGFMYAIRCDDILVCKASSSITAGNSGSLKVHQYGTFGSEGETTESITAYARVGDVSSGNWCYVRWTNGRYEIVMTEC